VTDLPPWPLLDTKLHEAVRLARERLAARMFHGEGNKA